MRFVTAAFIVANGAARNSRMAGQIRLRPVEIAARCPTELWRQNYVPHNLHHYALLPIMIDIVHIRQINRCGESALSVRAATNGVDGANTRGDHHVG